ncbi:phage integrase SAM-like domain-containing protein [Sanguibacter sp. Z1732]|uniref:phage integrase SAM-like domain-containing protein n=1 Tax=Sanguibacter sp. Z1732 TaxID=3435412 RepID=UPI003D9CA076
MNALAIELQTYFTTFAHAQRNLSGHTISTYRDTWRMLITFLAARTGTRIERIDIGDIDAENVTAFLDYLEDERGNSTATRNTRLSGIRAVLAHALPLTSSTLARSPACWRSHPNAIPNRCSSSSLPQSPTP